MATEKVAIDDVYGGAGLWRCRQKRLCSAANRNFLFCRTQAALLLLVKPPSSLKTSESSAGTASAS